MGSARSNESKNHAWMFLFLCWVVTLVATAGSLFFSEVMHFPPCVLCWYQRICMYPLVFIYFAGLFPLNRSVLRFTVPLLFTGWIMALYHILVYHGVIPESLTPCTEGVSCAAVFFEWFGFISIPVLSFTAFTVLLILSFCFKVEVSKYEK
ncbi:disulfide bond formation protein B [bacterium]|nr:disulfide bond formation protein B [bacterium]